MTGARSAFGAGRATRQLNLWPPMIDLVTSTLMVFLLVGFLQTALDPKDAEELLTRNEQTRFLRLFDEAFSDELADGTVAVTRNLNFLQITFSDRVLFASAEHRLQRDGRLLLERCARVLAAASATGYEQIQVEGHTDNLTLRRPSYPADNWELSTARALAVVRFLRETSALEPAVFSANGYADHRPVASNRTAAGRARNRRIEIRLFFSVGAGQLGGSR